jgi:hypothetical protein
VVSVREGDYATRVAAHPRWPAALQAAIAKGHRVRLVDGAPDLADWDTQTAMMGLVAIESGSLVWVDRRIGSDGKRYSTTCWLPTAEKRPTPWLPEGEAYADALLAIWGAG